MRKQASRFRSNTTCLLVAVLVLSAAMPPQRVPDKRDRTPAQRKIDSHVLEAIHGAPDAGLVQIDARRRALVDVRTDVSPRLEREIRRLKGAVVSRSPRDRSIVAWIPLRALEALAANPAVQAIVPAARGITNKPVK